MAGTSAASLTRGPAVTATAPRARRVLMVVGAYHPEVSGGGLQCRTLVQALRSRVAFTVLATTRAPGSPARDEVDGVAVHRVGVSLHGAVGRVRAMLALARTFWSLRDRFDIVHLHGFTRKAILFVWLARLLGKRTIYKMTSVGAEDALAAGRDWLGRRTLRAIDHVISVSPALTDRYRSAGLDLARLVEIANGVDLARFAPATDAERRALRGSLGLPVDVPVVVFVGFFSRDKAPDRLVEAWCRLRGAGRRAALLLIGATDAGASEVDPRLVAEVQARIGAAGGDADVTFVERTHDVPRYLRASDVFVMPSLREGLPNALLEAMAAGLPCIASRLPGVTDAVIDDGVDGRLVPPGNVEALTAALEGLLADPAAGERLGAQARRTVAARFSIEATAQRTLTLYELLDRR